MSAPEENRKKRKIGPKNAEKKVDKNRIKTKSDLSVEASDGAHGSVPGLASVIIPERKKVQQTMLKFLNTDQISTDDSDSHSLVDAVESGDEDVDSGDLKDFSKKPNFYLPESLQKYYQYNGHMQGSNNKREPISMTCLLCTSSEINEGRKPGKIVGTPYYNFKRHLKIMHPGEFSEKELVASKPNNPHLISSSIGPEDCSSALALWVKPNNNNAYAKSHPVQKRFEKDLLDCICIDLLPLDFVQRPTFIKLIRNLNQHIRTFSRQTVGRRLHQYHEVEFKQKMKRILRELDANTLHIILDMWTDRQKSAMMGIKCQFINKDWKLINTAIAFRHFPAHHTASSIRKIFNEVLHDTYGIGPDKIGFVVGDNASNVKSAFSDYDMGFAVCYAEENGISELAEEDEWEDLDDFEDESLSESEDENGVQTDDLTSVQSELDKWAQASIPKLPCYSHLIQLAIHDAMKSAAVVGDLVRDVKKLKRFFHASTYWYSKFKAAAGKGLVNQADTRWNTVNAVFDRMSEKKVEEALDAVLSETRKSSNPCKVSFSSADFETMKIVATLLAPLTQATNYLQANSVTSSKVIPAISCAYKVIARTDVEDNVAAKKLQEALLSCLKERFGCDVMKDTNDPEEIKRLNRITRDEIFKNKNLVIATLLDPRFKMRPFLDPTDPLNQKNMLITGAKKILDERYVHQKGLLPQSNQRVEANEPLVSRTSTKPSLFDLLPQEDRENNGELQDEIASYLKLENEPEDSDPLVFWKKKEFSFPVLAKLAKIFLGIPASSGSVERLFSISGALQRSRRSRLKWTTIEKMLCYREIRTRQLFGK